MARFIVRVELRDTKNDPAAYLRLHFAMRAKGFRREFSSNGTLFRLPHAEYLLDADMTVQAVKNRSKFDSALPVAQDMQRLFIFIIHLETIAADVAWSLLSAV